MSRFAAVVTLILGVGYAYVALSLGSGAINRAALAIPFVLVWLVPIVYWSRDRDGGGRFDDVLHIASYLSMAWLSFLVVFTLARDAAVLAMSPWPDTAAYRYLREFGTALVYYASVTALMIGALVALRGPRLKRVEVPVQGLHADLDGYTIAQISDLHVGLTIRKGYVRRVVALANAQHADAVVLTGDIVDGSVEALSPHVAPLADLEGPVFFILGNHDCYSGAARWIEHFRTLGMHVLLNSGELVRKGTAALWMGGVVDPAARMANPLLVPRADLAAEGGSHADFRVLLAHNPKLAQAGARAAFDLQLSGHTHAGQFFPWTLAVRMVHSPHVAGLSREGSMWVYVSAGTGTWGPPVRFGTQTELTLVTLRRIP